MAYKRGRGKGGTPRIAQRLPEVVRLPEARACLKWCAAVVQAVGTPITRPHIVSRRAVGHERHVRWRPSKLWTKLWTLAVGWGLALGWLGLCAALLVPERGLSEHRVAPSEIAFRAPYPDSDAMRFGVVGSRAPLSQQFRPRQDGARRFHHVFDVDAFPDGPEALWLPSLGGPALVAVNGSLLGRSRAAEPALPALGSDAALLDISDAYLVPGRNTLDIWVDADPGRVGFGPVFLGEREALAKAETRRAWWGTWLPVIMITGFGLSVAVALVGLVAGRAPLTYAGSGALGLAGLLLGARASDGSELGRVLAPMGVGAGLCAALAALSVLLCAHLLRRTDPSERGRRALILATGALSALGPALVLANTVLPTAGPLSWMGAHRIAGLGALSPLPLALGAGLPAMLHDLRGRLSRLQRLERRVDEQSEVLDARTARLLSEMRSRAVLEERQRVTRDIHDGIGGNLVSLLLRLRTGSLAPEQVSDEIQAGLHDLRLVVDALDSVGEDLGSALTTFRARAEPQARAAGIALHWSQSEQLPRTLPRARSMLDLYRILQEAMTNALRHAGARNLWIDIGVDGAAPERVLVLDVADDGGGFDVDAAKPGRGLGNMRKRARDLGAAFVIRPREGGGTRLRLEMPLGAGVVAPDAASTR